MNDTQITVQGFVGAMPGLKKAGDTEVATFRLGSTPRYLNRRTNEWVDAPTQWYTVRAWRGLARNVAESLRKGDGVTVVGRLNVTTWTAQDGSERGDLGRPRPAARHHPAGPQREAGRPARAGRARRAAGGTRTGRGLRAGRRRRPGDRPPERRLDGRELGRLSVPPVGVAPATPIGPRAGFATRLVAHGGIHPLPAQRPQGSR